MIKAALLIAIATLTLAQTPSPQKKLEFEVASIHLAKDDGNHDSDTDKGLYRSHNLTLKRLIALAYNIDARQISGGPNWLDSDGYDIKAKIPDDVAQHPALDNVPQMMQNLLADRFQLIIHREPVQISGYALVVAKKGPKMTPAVPDETGSTLNSKNTHLTARNAAMEAFAKHLSRNRDIGMMVVDKTGLSGRFDFELDWVPEALKPEALKPNPDADDRPSIFTALQEQLGLKLEPAKVPVQAVVIDHAAKPQAN